MLVVAQSTESTIAWLKHFIMFICMEMAMEVESSNASSPPGRVYCYQASQMLWLCWSAKRTVA